VGVEIDLSPIPAVSLSIECIIWSGFDKGEGAVLGANVRHPIVTKRIYFVVRPMRKCMNR